MLIGLLKKSFPGVDLLILEEAVAYAESQAYLMGRSSGGLLWTCARNYVLNHLRDSAKFVSLDSLLYDSPSYSCDMPTVMLDVARILRRHFLPPDAVALYEYMFGGSRLRNLEEDYPHRKKHGWHNLITKELKPLIQNYLS